MQILNKEGELVAGCGVQATSSNKRKYTKTIIAKALNQINSNITMFQQN